MNIDINIKELIMAKYDIKYSCGHTGRIELYGKTCDREGKIEYLEKYGNCPDCYRKQVCVKFYLNIFFILFLLMVYG